MKVQASELPEADLFCVEPSRLTDLPSAVVGELSASAGCGERQRILELLRIAGRPLNIDELIVGSFRKYGVTLSRRRLNHRLHRLVKSGLVEAFGGGVYGLSKPEGS